MLNPINKKVFVKVVVEKAESPSGLIILDKKAEVETCTVLAVAEGVSEVAVGDTVLVAVSQMATVPGGKLVDVKDILGILDD